MVTQMPDLLGAFIKMLILSISMSISSFLSGLLPLSIKFSPVHLRYISVLSMGILISTALVVIIPEGIESVYDTHDKEKAPVIVGLLLLAGFVLMYVLDHLHIVTSLLSSTVKYTGIDLNLDQLEALPQVQPPAALQQSSQLQLLQDNSAQQSEHSGSLGRKILNSIQKFTRPLLSSPLTLGLVIHSLTDGIALTSSIFSQKQSLNFIVFVAIFIHKLPTSFSLVTILISEGLPKSAVKLHLFIFSSSLTLGSLLSFIAIQLLAGDSSEVGSHVAVMLMFSGGSFLYIGVHTMLEIMGDDDLGKQQQLARASGGGSGSSTADTIVVGKDELTVTEFGITLVGFLLPTLVLLVKE